MAAMMDADAALIIAMKQFVKFFIQIVLFYFKLCWAGNDHIQFGPTD